MMTNCIGCLYNKDGCSLPRMLECPVKENNMDYEKMYKEALERAKKFEEKYGGGYAEYIFPELTESEDERILRVISEAVITFFSDYANDFEDEDRDAALAWLEKQKEQKPAWSEEDKKMLLSIINAFRNGTVSTIGQEQWLKNLPERFNLQSKPEWSEMDEDILNCCISSIEEAKENRYAYKETDGDTSYDREIAWLKSLRPQPSWKPSEDELTKKHLEGYIKGRNDALREMSDFMESHFNTQSGTSIKSGGNE